MTKEERIERKRWVEDMSRNEFMRAWLGEYDAESMTFSGGEILVNLEKNAAYAETDEAAVIARRMIKVHNAYMSELSKYLKTGRIDEVELQAQLADQARMVA